MIDQPTFARRLVLWYRRARRDLPWRVPRDGPARSRPDPYHVLVSEAMLQQTQVATVIPYFHRFIATFPTVQSLADAEGQSVLRHWQGLGYYRRARNLQAAAREIVARFDGRVPRSLDDLLSLPGVGRYTAGAIASLAYDSAAPIVDGNVVRILCRLDRIEADPSDRETQELLWTRAADLLPRRTGAGDFNSAMMELGATVCTPRNPQCPICPVQRHCQAFHDGVQERIPWPKVPKQTPLHRRDVYCIFRRRAANDSASSADAIEWLIEQRPPTGRWAGLWQFITIDPATSEGKSLASAIEKNAVSRAELGVFKHSLTHRRYELSASACEWKTRSPFPPAGAEDGKTERQRRWVSLGKLDPFPLSRIQLKIAAALTERSEEAPANVRNRRE